MKVITLREPADEIESRVRGVGRGTLATVVGRGFDVIATYAFYAIIARSVSVADFGKLAFGFAVLSICAAVARLGLDQALLAIRPNGSTNRFALQIVLPFSIAIGLLILIAWRLAGHPVPRFGLWLAATLPCVVLGQLIAGALRASGQVVVAAIADTVVQPAVAAAAALLVSVYAPSTANFVLALAASWAIILVFAWRVDWRGDRATRTAAGTFLGVGLAMLGVSLLRELAAAAGIILLGFFDGSAELGRYALADKVAVAFLLLHGAITTATTPFMRALADEPALLARYYHTITRWMLTMSLPLVVLTLGASRPVLSLFGPQYANSTTPPLVLLSLSGVMFVLSGPAGSILLCTGHARQLLRVTAVGALSLIIIVALLAPFGVLGVAIGVTVGRLIGRALLVFEMRRCAAVEYSAASLLLIAAGSFMGVGITRITAPAIGPLPAVVAGSAIALALAFVVLVRSGDLAIIRTEFRRA